jgi:uncharacterized membrane protein (UPF0127 family)
MAFALLNATTKRRIATRVDIARTRRARRRGLLGRRYMNVGTALVLVPCWAVHTAFMKLSIDLIFVDREGRAIHIVHALRPWRAAVSVRAQAVIELPGGTLRGGAVLNGDRVCIVPAEAQYHGPTGVDDEPDGSWLGMQTC